MFLPGKIVSLVEGEDYKTDGMGMSGSSVLIYGNKVLKVQECGEEAENEYRMMKYLQGRLPVPEIYAYEKAEGKDYLLMSKCRGEVACSRKYMENTAVQCRMLADGLKRLWETDISECPSDQRLSRKLAQAEYNVTNGLVDMDNVEPDTFGENGFESPFHLLQWLYDNMPEEELVLSHGDYCLPNIFGIHDTVTGFIDLGKTGIADKWCDIALCYRSLSDNCSGKFADPREDSYCGRGKDDRNNGKQEKCGSTGDKHWGYSGELLFRELGIDPDWEKIRYYILLDELF